MKIEPRKMLALFLFGFGLWTVLNPSWLMGLMTSLPLVGGIVSSMIAIAPPIASGIAMVIFGTAVYFVGLKPSSGGLVG